MKLLVTGGAGFIGSNFIHYWLKHYPEDSIVNLDKLTYAGHLSSLKDVSENSRYKFVRGDICSQKLTDSLMVDIDTVVHFAAESHVDRSILHPSEFVRSNVLGTQVLLESALKNKVKRFHLISTDEVFGSLPLNSRTKFSESTPYDPKSPYSASKSAADHLVRAYFHTFGLPITITNCSNNFGPYQNPEKFIPRMITNLILNQKIPIYGDGKNVRDWLYVEDHCWAIDLIVHNGQPGQTYCIGGQKKEFSNFEIAQKIIKLMGMDKSMLEFVADRPSHDRRYAVNWSKVHRELGWSPAKNFDDRLKSTVEWYSNNKWWWMPLKKQAESIYRK